MKYFHLSASGHWPALCVLISSDAVNRRIRSSISHILHVYIFPKSSRKHKLADVILNVRIFQIVGSKERSNPFEITCDKTGGPTHSRLLSIEALKPY